MQTSSYSREVTTSDDAKPRSGVIYRDAGRARRTNCHSSVPSLSQNADQPANNRSAGSCKDAAYGGRDEKDSVIPGHALVTFAHVVAFLRRSD